MINRKDKKFGLIFKKVLRYSSSEKKYRLFRLIYNTRELQENKWFGKWRSLVLQVALMPKFLFWEPGMSHNQDYRLILSGVSLHFRVDSGGYNC